MINKVQVKNYIKSELGNYLMHRGIDISKSFRCLNPTHCDSNPSMSYDKRRQKVHCFSCGVDYDIFDLIGIEYGLTENVAIFSKGYELFGLDIESQKWYSDGSTTQSVSYYTQCGDNVKESSYKPDFTEVLGEAHKVLLNNESALLYLHSRGLSVKTIKAYKLGYSEKGHNSLLEAYPEYKSKSKKAVLYKYVFPYLDENGKSSYFITEIIDRQQIDEFNGKYRKLNKGKEIGRQLEVQLFNERYLKCNGRPNVIFICEGIYDALSIEEVGGKAIALVGVGQNRLLRMLKKYKPDSFFVLYLDNDEAGQRATKRLKEEFDNLGVSYMIKNSNSGKDANEALQEDREAFSEHIQNIIADIETERQTKAEQEKEDYLSIAASFNLKKFIDDIEKNRDGSFVSTGFTSVDALLDGGLYAGLYCVGAISSLGKTSFCLQIADNIARTGQDVLIFSLEMAKSELIAKSISKLTFVQDLKKYGVLTYAKTTRDILTGTRYSGYSKEERELVISALEEYSYYANHIFIYEGSENIGVKVIRETVEKHKKFTGKIPVVIIDYIQILAPYSERYTDKQNTDRAVIELKRISRDYATAVICISSFNRENYTVPVNMTSFKESGAIEFSADVLIGLQYEGMDWAEREGEKERNKRIRELLKNQIILGKCGQAQSIQVKVIKNRNGSKGDTCIDFYPMFNYFADKNGDNAYTENIGNNWKPLSENLQN